MQRGYKRKFEELNLLIMQENLVDIDTAMKHREILSETSQIVNGKEHTIVKYKQVLQSFTDKGGSKRNWNGRAYTEGLVVGHLNRNPIIQHELKAGPKGTSTWLAEYGHPYEPNKDAALMRQNMIDPKYISNKINKYWVEGNLLMSECETLAESWGAVLTARILTNLPAMASLRSVGRCGADGFVLPDGFWIITFDTVVRPSHKEAMQTAPGLIVPGHSMNESVMKIDLSVDGAKNFILSESARQIEMISALGRFDANTIQVDNKNITMKRISDDGLMLETIFIPLNVVIGSNYHKLFE